MLAVQKHHRGLQCVSVMKVTKPYLLLCFSRAHQFEIVTLTDQLICAADSREGLSDHLVHILKVMLVWVFSSKSTAQVL